jgi:NAD(P)-dependent dehydrogenase (short-subunit alcohol dehydrogenase family)
VRQILSQGGGGSLVTVGSRASRRGDANITAYSASKFGVIGLTQSFAMAYAKDGIRVNCVCPGAVDTDMYVRQTYDFAAREGVDFLTARQKMGDVIPLGRLTSGDDVAKAIVWFACDETSHVTGQAFNVNGGSWMN